jgi:ribosome-binding protein aMBF1 (putative translation factor)
MERLEVLENCENCGRAIGKLEMAHVWSERVVCRECHTRLNTQNAPNAFPSKPAPKKGAVSLRKIILAIAVVALAILGYW